MANPYIIAQNLGLYTLSATSTDASYPLINLQTGYEADLWKSAALTNAQKLVIDFGAATPINSMVLNAHNFGSLGFTGSQGVNLIGADDAALTTNPVTAVVLVQSDLAGNPMIVRTFATQTKRYWGLWFNIGAGTMSQYPTLGSFFVAGYMTFSSPQSFPFRALDPQFITVVSTTISGRLRSTQVLPGRAMFEFQFKLQTAQFRLDFQYFLKIVRGRLRPFYFIDTDSSVYYVQLTQDYNPVDYVNAALTTPQKIIMQKQIADVQ